MQLRRVGETKDILGESPIWCTRTQALYWVDIRGKQVRRHRPAERLTDSWAMPDLPGSLAVHEGGGLLVALRQGLYRFDPETAALCPAYMPQDHGPAMRFNDGKCDPRGRFWVGSLNDTARLPHGTLYRVDRHSFTPVLRGITIPNSLCWSPDSRTMYFADSWLHTLWAFPFDPDTGTLGDRREIARTEPPAVPDGATVDEEGCIWFVAHDGWRIVRCSPKGDRLEEIELPVQLPTSVAFGGPDLRTLYITTKTYQLSEAALQQQPLAGALLALDVGVRGRPEPRFRG